MDWELVLSSLGPLAIGAISASIPLALASFVLGMVIAVGIALARIGNNPFLRSFARGYVSIVRGTPLVVQLFIIFYGLGSIGLRLEPWPSAIIAFSINVGGYAAEIVRAAMLSIPKGQWEAAGMLGMTRQQALARIILPQAARVAVPPLSNTFISLVKDTSLASTILVTEMFRIAQQIVAPSGKFMLIYGVAAVIYWVICVGLSTIQNVLERRLERNAV